MKAYLTLFIGFSIIIFSQFGLKSRYFDDNKSGYFDYNNNKILLTYYFIIFALACYCLLNGILKYNSVLVSLFISFVICVLVSLGHIFLYLTDNNYTKSFTKRWNIEISILSGIFYFGFMCFLNIWIPTSLDSKFSEVDLLLLIVYPLFLYLSFFNDSTKDFIRVWSSKFFSNSKPISIAEKNEAITYLKLGNKEYRNGRYKEAIKYYSKAIEIDSNFKEAYKNREIARKKL